MYDDAKIRFLFVDPLHTYEKIVKRVLVSAQNQD